MGAFSNEKFIGVGNEPKTSQHFHPWFGSSSQNAANKIHMHETDCQHSELWRHRAIWIDLPLETRQAGTQPVPRETFAVGEYWLELSDDERGCSSVTTDPSSWHAALLGWCTRYPVPYLSTVRLNCDRHTAPATSLQKKHRQEQRNSKNLVLAGCSSMDFWRSNSGWAHMLQLFRR